MSWSLRKEKEGIFWTIYFIRRKFFRHLCFISMYSVLNKFQNMCTFMYQKTLFHTRFCLFIKSAEIIHCILSLFHKNDKDMPDFTYKDLNTVKFIIKLLANQYVNLIACFPIKNKKRTAMNTNINGNMIIVNNFFAHWVREIEVKV